MRIRVNKKIQNFNWSSFAGLNKLIAEMQVLKGIYFAHLFAHTRV